MIKIYNYQKKTFKKMVAEGSIKQRMTKDCDLFAHPVSTCKILHYMTTPSDVLLIFHTLSIPGLHEKTAKKNIAMGICMHYTYI